MVRYKVAGDDKNGKRNLGDGIGWGFGGIDGEMSGVESASMCHGKVVNKYFNLKILDDGGRVISER